jgi:hypothetical protein
MGVEEMNIDEQYENYLIDSALHQIKFGFDEEIYAQAVKYLELVAPKELEGLRKELSMDKYWETKGL